MMTYRASLLTAVCPSLLPISLQKEKVEGVLTGDITSHTHSKYALGTSLTEEMQRATAKEASLQAIIDIINGASTVEGSFRKAIADLIGGAPESLDTLKEIADKLAKDDDLHKAIEEAIAQKADKSTTLGGYGITDTYTKKEVATILAAYLTSEVAKTDLPTDRQLSDLPSVARRIRECYKRKRFGQCGDINHKERKDNIFYKRCYFPHLTSESRRICN